MKVRMSAAPRLQAPQEHVGDRVVEAKVGVGHEVKRDGHVVQAPRGEGVLGALGGGEEERGKEEWRELGAHPPFPRLSPQAARFRDSNGKRLAAQPGIRPRSASALVPHQQDVEVVGPKVVADVAKDGYPHVGAEPVPGTSGKKR